MTKPPLRSFLRFVAPGIISAVLAACGGGDSSSPAPVTYTIGGSVTGLTGSGLVLQDNNGDDLAVSAAGAFTFTTTLAQGSAYSVTVKTQPSAPRQNCVVSQGTGSVGTANVTNVSIACGAPTFTIGGAVSGLTGSGLVLQNNAGDDLAVSTAGSFTFATALADGATYAVTVKTQPSSQNCVVSGGSGTVAAADVSSVTVRCDFAFAYVTNEGDDTVSVYLIDATTGALAAVGTPVATGTSPFAIATRRDSRSVYVANEASNDISVFASDPTSGLLTPISGSPFAAGTDPRALAFNPSGAYLYVANHGSNNLSAYAVDAVTGALTPLPTPTYATGPGPSDVQVDPSGTYVYVANNGGSNDISVFAITAGTGELTPVAGSPFPAGDNPHSLTVMPESGYSSKTFLYTANSDGVTSTISGFSVNPSTGGLTALTGSPFALAVSNYIAAITTYGGPLLYVTTGASVVGYNIDGQTGLLTIGAGFPIAAGTNAFSVTFFDFTGYVYVCNAGAATISAYVNDLFSVELTPIASSPFASGNNPHFMAILN